MASDMRAALFDRYGPPEVLYEGRAPRPVPGPGEVLVRVHAASVNGGEVMGRAGRLRLVTGSRFPKRTGIDFAGVVEALGPGVVAPGPAVGPAVGDRVWGVSHRFGTAAEYVAIRPRRLALAPEGLDLVRAAALPTVGATSIVALRRKAGLRPGERLLVRGAAGGVGSVAVQLGRALGAHVTALARAEALGFVRELGAHEAFDHTTTDPAGLAPFDVVLNTAPTGVAGYRRLLAPGGRMVSITFDVARVVPSVAYILASTVFGSRRVRFFAGEPRNVHALLAELARHVETGAVRPVVDTVHDLADIAEAHRALEKGGVRGKHVIRVVP